MIQGNETKVINKPQFNGENQNRLEKSPSLLALWLLDGLTIEFESLELLENYLRALGELGIALDVQERETFSSSQAPSIYRKIWTTCITLKNLTIEI